MKIVRQVDLLIVGGSTGAVDFALEQKRSGLSVMIVTAYTYFGEERCAYGKTAPKTPMQIKRELDRKVIENGIDFTFRTWPVKRFDSGMIFGNHEGLFAVQAGAVFDFTQTFAAARLAGRVKPAGKRQCSYTRHFLRLDKSQASVSGTVELEDGSIRSLERAELQLRLKHYSPDLLLSPDLNEIDFNFEILPPQPDGGVFLPGEEFQLKKYVPSDSVKLGDLPVLGTYDVAVIGGGTAGAPAGISAGRHGMKCVILEELPRLGGLGTAGRIGCYWYGVRNGFTAEMDAAVAELTAHTRCGNPEQAWNVECKEHFYERECAAAGTDVFFQHCCCGVVFEAGKIRAVIAAGPYGAGLVEAKVFLDCTGNAVLAAACGAETGFSDAFEPAIQGAGMSILDPGTDCFNSDYMFTDETHNRDTDRAFLVGRARNADHYDLCQLSGTRERRRIVGDLVLQAADFYKQRNYSDTIALAESNFDTHGFIVDPLLLFQSPKPGTLRVKIPLRALLSPGIENLLSCGLGISAMRDAMPLVRMQADVQNQGFAAAAAASLAVAENAPLRKINVRRLQKELADAGFFPAEVLSETDNDPAANDENAQIFSAPDLTALRRDFADAPDFEKALRLALLKCDDGRTVLENALKKGIWDEGWHYRGMGQFGKSASRLDAAVIALAGVSSDGACLEPLLRKLTPEIEFSHVRSICYFLMKHPVKKYAAVLHALLAQFPGSAVADYRELCGSAYSGIVEVAERNLQLKELYLAGALHACDAEDALSVGMLRSYRDGVHSFYSIYAEKFSRL